MLEIQFSREHDKALLVKALNEAVKSTGIATQPDFSELWQQICINFIFADRRNELIARVTPVGEVSTEAINEGGKFAKLHGPESLCMFAEVI